MTQNHTPRLVSLLGLIIAIASFSQLDHGVLVFLTDAAVQAHERTERYKTLMLVLGGVIFLSWPAQAMLTVLRVPRDVRAELVFWQRAAVVQLVILAALVVALCWTFLQHTGV